MQLTPEQIMARVASAIEQIPYPQQPVGLYEPIRYVLALGGKRIRPVFLLLAYSLYDERIDRAMTAAVGLETYHNYTLLHDDLMDRADIRRGQPTVHRKWNANTAILSGDSMLVLACEMIAKLDLPKANEAMRLFLKTALEVGEGQQYDMNFESRQDVSEAEYIEMIRLKTSVLIAAAVKMGALLGGATDEDAELLYKFGEQIGLAFQLQDDWLDVFGDERTFGKRIGGDILCNKKTYMLINAMQRAEGAMQDELNRWLTEPCTDEAAKIHGVTQIYRALGVGEMCQQRIDEFFNAAFRCLDQVSLPEERKQHLRDFGAQLVGRNY